MVGDNGEGTCILLRRLSFSGCLYDMDALFNRGEATISVIFNSMLRLLYGTWNGLLVNLRENTGPGRWLTHAKLIEAFIAVRHIGPFQHLCGFIDGTCRPIARPSRHQRIWYSGHKKLHVQKFQAIMTPFGIVVHLFGPVEGTRHDSAMLRMSGLLNQLQNDLPPRSAAPGDVFAIYGDSAYPLRTNLHVPFTGPNLTPDEAAFNTRMSECRPTSLPNFHL